MKNIITQKIVQVGGVRTCFRNYLRCDLHPHCDPVDGSTDPTAEDEVGCEDDYRRKEIIPRDATSRCQSPHHNEDSVKANLSRGVVWTRAILNDDKTECWNNEDEVDRSSEWISYYLPGLKQPYGIQYVLFLGIEIAHLC